MRKAAILDFEVRVGEVSIVKNLTSGDAPVMDFK